jgi:hypothetical protein
MIAGTCKSWVKARDTKLKRLIYNFLKSVLTFDIPPIRVVYLPLYGFCSALINVVMFFVRGFYWKPVFLTHVSNRPRRLNLDGVGMPQVIGRLKIRMGDDCRLSTKITFSGGAVRQKRLEPGG